ncbi:hypothetical protein J8L70_11295 [Pseudoalteromonas sp. MMG010]|nr:hypothetical protein [Pseudoalteromonas sp. MMG010]
MFGFFKKQDVTLSPAIKGRILREGVAQKHIKITRKLTYGDEYIDKTHSDENGYFSFEKKQISSSNPNNMFFNSSLGQHLYIGNEDDENENTVLWYTFISFVEQQDSLIPYLSNFVCDLQLKAQTIDIAIPNTPHAITVYTRCMQ